MDSALASVAAAGGAAAAARPDPSPLIERVFRAIEAERMRGLPFVNPALAVEAVGFRRWDGRWLGVLITPWFMNLMLLPDAPAAWRAVRHGEYAGYALPSGVYEFLSAHEPALGDFQSCSLFSPVFEFADQETARITANCALKALFDDANREGPAFDVSPDASPRVAPHALPGGSPDGSPDAGAAGPREPEPVATSPSAASSLGPADTPAPTPLSKRAFLRGEFLDAGRRHRR